MSKSFLDHDDFSDQSGDRIRPEQWRNPRLVIIDHSLGGRFWSELTKDGDTMDTTLTGRVFDVIEKELDYGKYGGQVEVDGVLYVFAISYR